MDAVERKQNMAAGAWQNLHDRDAKEAKAEAKAKSFDDKGSAPAAGSAGAPETRAAPTAPAAVMKSANAPTASPSGPRTESTATPPSAAQAESTTILPEAPPPPQATTQASPMTQPARESAAPARADAAHGARDGSAAGAAAKDAARARSDDPNAGLYPEHWLASIRNMLEENRRDLERHAEDFAARRGFTYTVLDPATREVIGCVYIYPDKDGGSDAAVSSWVRASRAELDGDVRQAVSRWLVERWPFENTAYATD